MAAVRDDRPDAGEAGQAVAQELTTGPDVVWLGGIRASAHGQTQDLDEDRCGRDQGGAHARHVHRSVVAEVASSRQSGLDCSWRMKVSARWIVMSSYT
jgi:hypothetical protein